MPPQLSDRGGGRAFSLNFAGLRRNDAVQMAHFTAGFDFGFAIEMHCRGGVFDDGTYPAHIITDQVLHHHIAVAGAIAERPVGNRADMLLELIHNAAVLGSNGQSCALVGRFH